MTIGTLLALATAALAAASVAGPRAPRAWLAATLGGCAAILAAAMAVLIRGTEWDWTGALAIGGAPVHLRIDALSALFLALAGAVGGAGALYSREYWSDRARPDSAGRGRAWWSALVLTMTLVLSSANGLHFLIVWEAFALCGYFLITLDRERGEARAAGWLYLAASHAGTLALFAFFSLLAARTGGFELGPMRDRSELAPLLWLALFGFGVKAGLFPLHVWLPPAHANAPSHVSGILSAVAIKLGVYGLFRFTSWLPAPAGAAWAVVSIGAISALLGAALSLVQTDLKRLLAYCSVENVGVIAIGLGAAMLGAAHGDAPWGRLALAAALLHVWNHGLLKALLFCGAGSVVHATGTREMSRLGGLWRAMPWTAALLALGSAGIAVLPPLNGFVSEWLLYLGLFDAAGGPPAIAAAILPATIALCLSGALALAAFVKASGLVLLGAPRSRAASGLHECGWRMLGPMVALAGACLFAATFPTLLWRLVAQSVGAWRPAWSGAAPPASIAALGRIQLGLVLLLLAAAAALRRRVSSNGIRRAVTWDCGYAAPTARMQYTGGSFAAIASAWFRRILRPSRFLRRPRGPFPARADHVERAPDPVFDGVLGPAAGAILRASTIARRLQHGHLPDYVLYLVAGLAAVAAIVVIGAAS